MLGVEILGVEIIVTVPAATRLYYHRLSLYVQTNKDGPCAASSSKRPRESNGAQPLLGLAARITATGKD